MSEVVKTPMDKRTKRLMAWAIAIGVLVAVLGGILIGAMTTENASYKAAVLSVRPMGSGGSRVGVAVDIKNVGNMDGAPSCSVGVYAVDGTELGNRTVDLQSIKAGSDIKGTVLVDVKSGTVSEPGTVIVCN